MKLLDIKKYPDRVLKKKAEKVSSIETCLENLVNRMAYTMYKTKGIGLAAPQVGILKRVIVYDAESGNKGSFGVLINPQIIDAKERIVSENEGCLSIPHFRSNVKRFDEIIVKGEGIKGEKLKIEAKGILSIVIQHEIDHLNGVLLIDHASYLKRSIYKKQLVKYSKVKR